MGPGAWVLQAIAERQGGHQGHETWTRIDDRRAGAWLARNAHDLPDDLQRALETRKA